MQKIGIVLPPATTTIMGFWLILGSIITLIKCNNPAVTAVSFIGDPLHTNTISIRLDTAVLKAKRACGGPRANSPVKSIIINSNIHTKSTEHVSSLRPMLCTAPSAGMLCTAQHTPFNVKNISPLARPSHYISGAGVQHIAAYVIESAVEHCQCSHTSHSTISSKGLATNFPSRNLFNDNLTRVSSGSNFTTVHPTVNMAPASRSTATARAKSAKSADQDYVLRNKHKVRGKKTGAVDKLLDDLPGETLFPPKLRANTPGVEAPTLSEVSPELVDADKGQKSVEDGPAPGSTTANKPVGEEGTVGSENINDFLNLINNPTNASGDDDVEMAAEEVAPTKDPSPATIDSPSSSPVKKKKKQSSTVPSETHKNSADKSSQEKDSEKEKKRKTKTVSKTKPTAQPASVLKTGKLGSGSRLSFADEAPKKKAPHEHKYKRVIIELSVDLTTEALNQFEGDNNKKAVYAIQQLVVNMMIADKHTVIHHAEDPSMDSTIGGTGGNAVPTNMTALSNYVKGFNPKPFANNHSYEPQGGQARGRCQGNLVYGWATISCDKDPEGLLQQLSYEWSKFGNRICVKELQSGSTLTAFIVWFVTTHCPKKVYVEEMCLITESAITALERRDFFDGNSQFSKFSSGNLPMLTFRISIPKIPNTMKVVVWQNSHPFCRTIGSNCI